MPTKLISAKPTISASAIYAAGDAVGGLLEFEDALGAFAAEGEIIGAIVIDDAAQDAALDLVLFNQSFTAEGDNDPFDPSEADMENCLGVVAIAAAEYLDTDTGPSVARAAASKFPVPIVLDDDVSSIFGQLVTSGTPTYDATDDLTVKLIVRR
jgi:hypothetical protein